MSILSGYGKFKRYVLTDNGYKLCSQWTSSNTVHFDDGNTAQTKVGAINGITDSLTATSSNIALSAMAGKSLQDQVAQLNTGLGKVGTIVGGTAVQASVPPAIETVIGQITLPAGRWIIMSSCWFNAETDDMLVNLSIKDIIGTTGWFRQPRISGIVIANTQTTYQIVGTQWSAESVPIVGIVINAIRIA